ncbi:MAG: cohesin domain-containing protein [Patescibacteria group bacterium]
MLILKRTIIYFLTFLIIFSGLKAYAQAVNVDASKLLAQVEVGFSPRSGSFVEGSTFQVPILLNTKGRSINGIEVRVNFNKDKLSIINSTGGTSIIGVWVEPPQFDNTRGTASYVGVVPNGITTGSGLIGTITFMAKAPGAATVSVAASSNILLNDGLGTRAQVDLGRAEYTILTKAPEGVQVFSETHPIQSDWYNNNTPVLSWIKDPGVTGFSYELDDKPFTIPDNIIETDESTKTFESLSDGLWYFHIKANKANVWSTTGHFLIRIDTAPPAEFTPKANFLVAATINAEQTLVSFFTTDNLSGVDHYEVGVIDKSQPTTASPVFVNAESPFQVPLSGKASLEVIVRAVDKAGNVRDESIDVRLPQEISKFIQDNLVYILLGIILLGLIMLILHYLFGHHIIRYMRLAGKLMRNEKNEQAEATTKTFEERVQFEIKPKPIPIPEPVIKPYIAPQPIIQPELHKMIMPEVKILPVVELNDGEIVHSSFPINTMAIPPASPIVPPELPPPPTP